MNRSSIRVLAFSFLATMGLAAFLLPVARSQIQVAPSYIPIGVASSGSSSMVWFHVPTSGTVLVCQSESNTGTPLTGIRCVATRLP